MMAKSCGCLGKEDKDERMAEEIGINKLVVLKITGEKESVTKVLKKLPLILPADKMKMSPIIRNEHDNNVHVYIDVLLDREGGTNGCQS
jgi:hypothetical protein